MISQEECIRRFKERHGDKYDYSKVIYKGQQVPVMIYCKKCGRERANKKESISKEAFLKRAKTIHGDKYKYLDLDFSNSHDYITYECNVCGKIKKQLVYSHLNGKGCDCNKRLTKEEFIKRAELIHKNRYDYSKVNYQGIMRKVEIYCKKHKKYFMQIVVNHLQGSGCPICNESSGEKIIKNILEENNIKFERWKRMFGKLSYDFYISSKNLLIEYNGKQHYEKVNWSGKMTNDEMLKDLKIQRHNDWLKRKYAQKNNINLLVIPYTMSKEEILLKIKECVY